MQLEFSLRVFFCGDTKDEKRKKIQQFAIKKTNILLFLGGSNCGLKIKLNEIAAAAAAQPLLFKNKTI